MDFTEGARSKEAIAQEIEQTRLELDSIFRRGRVKKPNPVKKAWNTARQRASLMSYQVSRKAHQTDMSVRENIYTLVGSAVVIGLIVGWLIKRKH